MSIKYQILLVMLILTVSQNAKSRVKKHIFPVKGVLQDEGGALKIDTDFGYYFNYKHSFDESELTGRIYSNFTKIRNGYLTSRSCNVIVEYDSRVQTHNDWSNKNWNTNEWNYPSSSDCKLMPYTVLLPYYKYCCWHRTPRSYRGFKPILKHGKLSSQSRWKNGPYDWGVDEETKSITYGRKTLRVPKY